MSEPADAAVIDRILAELAKGRSLSTICRAPGMPARETVWRWTKGNDELAARVLEARECGFHAYAEETLELVQKCRDPHKARVLLDSRRWYLGKLSLAFAEKPVVIGAVLNVDAGDAFAAVAGALDRAAAGISRGGTSTFVLADESSSGSDSTAG
jgi:hypothetical protein